MNKIINYFKSITVELRKVSWLTKQQLINSTIIVGVFSILVAVFLFILDFEIKEVHIVRVDILRYAEEVWGIDVNDPDEFETVQDFDEDMNRQYNRYKLAGYDKKFKSIYVDR